MFPIKVSFLQVHLRLLATQVSGFPVQLSLAKFSPLAGREHPMLLAKVHRWDHWQPV